jgi:hypothetical protein
MYSVDNILMNFLQKRTTPSENVSFMGVMCAVNAVFALLGSFIPFSDLILVLFLPLVSALVGFLCQPKYLLAYLPSAVGVVLAVTCFSMGTTLFYVIPAILSGTLYGFLIQKQIPVSITVFLTAVLELALNYLMLPCIDALYEIDMIESIKIMLQINSYQYVDDIIPMFVFGYSLAQVGISHFIIQGVYSSFNFQYAPESWLSFWCPIVAGFFGVLALSLALVAVSVAYVFLAFGVYFTAFSSLNLLRKNPWYVYLTLGVMFALAVYSFAIWNGYFPKDSGMLLSAIFLLSVDTPSLLSSLLLSLRRKPSQK